MNIKQSTRQWTAKLLRQTAERLDPTPPPRIVINCDPPNENIMLDLIRKNIRKNYMPDGPA